MATFENRTQYSKEQDQLLKTILDFRFFNPWKNLVSNFDDMFSLRRDAILEIYITNVCNQNCEYCYLVKNKGLYPEDKRDPKLLLHNLRILYDFIMENDYRLPEIDFFTGEIWHTQFGLDVLDTTIEYLRQGMQVDHFLIASNCSFVNDDEQLQKIQSRINTFKQLNAPLFYSISVDGLILDQQTRPRNNNIEYTQEFYDKLFSFAKYNNFYFHPMVSPESIELWSENYDWWRDQCNYYQIQFYPTMMMLEVRSKDWTEEKIDCYCDLLIKMSKDFLQNWCNNDKKLFADTLVGIHKNFIPLNGYFPWCWTRSDSFNGCSVSTDLTVRLGDFAICPCHRTAYNKYLYGYFDVQNDKICGIKAVNPQMAVKVLMMNFNLCHFGCDSCVYTPVCLKGCYGLQLEEMQDPFIPVPTVCHFFDRKYSTLFQYWEDLGIIDYYRKINIQEQNSDAVVELLTTYEKWKEYKNGLG